MNDELKTVQGAKAKKLVGLLAEGKELKAAEQEAGITKSAIARNPKLLQRVEELVNNYTFDNVASTALVRARLMEIVLLGEEKDSVGAAKVIQPMLGVQATKEVVHRVVLDTPEVQESLKYVQDYVDAEFEEIEEEND